MLWMEGEITSGLEFIVTIKRGARSEPRTRVEADHYQGEADRNLLKGGFTATAANAGIIYIAFRITIMFCGMFHAVPLDILSVELAARRGPTTRSWRMPAWIDPLKEQLNIVFRMVIITRDGMCVIKVVWSDLLSHCVIPVARGRTVSDMMQGCMVMPVALGRAN